MYKLAWQQSPRTRSTHPRPKYTFKASTTSTSRTPAAREYIKYSRDICSIPEAPVKYGDVVNGDFILIVAIGMKEVACLAGLYNKVSMHVYVYRLYCYRSSNFNLTLFYFIIVRNIKK